LVTVAKNAPKDAMIEPLLAEGILAYKLRYNAISS